MYVKLDGYIEKASKLQEGEVDVVVTTPDLDSHGERIDPQGVNYKDYLKGNNVVLWAHDGFNLPIANTTKMWYEGNKLMARAKFYLKDEFPRKVYQYVVDNVVKAVSIGGLVEEFSSDGVTIKKLTMKEFSFVSVPANDKALVASKAMTTEVQKEINGMARMYARKMLVDSGEDNLHKDIEVLERHVAALKELAIGEPTQDKATLQTNTRVMLRTAQVVDHQVESVIRTIKLKRSSQ